MENSLAAKISNEVAEVYEDIVDNLKSTSRRVSKDTGDTLASTAVSLAHTAENLAETARLQSKTMAKLARREVREHPMAATALAAAAVALVGVAIAVKLDR